MSAAPLAGPVEIVGVGLLGTSLALALTEAGVDVLLTDIDADHVRTASQLGAGRPGTPEDRPALVVVAVPPARLGAVIADALARTAAWGAVVTDVGSVKSEPLAAVAAHPERARYVGGHPMAGTERSGPLSASARLFEGRPWAIAPHGDSAPEAVAAVEALVAAAGGVALAYDPLEHDRAVARVSHVPHLVAALVANRLADAPAAHLDLAGPGVRDVTRVAAGSPALYSQIAIANTASVVELLGEVRADLAALIDGLEAGDAARVEELLRRGNAGVASIPGKHGGAPTPTEALDVTIPDAPGSLARLFAAVDAAGVNIEDVHIEHDLGRQVGVVELQVPLGSADRLAAALTADGWEVTR